MGIKQELKLWERYTVANIDYLKTKVYDFKQLRVVIGIYMYRAIEYNGNRHLIYVKNLTEIPLYMRKLLGIDSTYTFEDISFSIIDLDSYKLAGSCAVYKSCTNLLGTRKLEKTYESKTVECTYEDIKNDLGITVKALDKIYNIAFNDEIEQNEYEKMIESYSITDAKLEQYDKELWEEYRQETLKNFKKTNKTLINGKLAGGIRNIQGLGFFAYFYDLDNVPIIIKNELNLNHADFCVGTEYDTLNNKKNILCLTSKSGRFWICSIEMKFNSSKDAYDLNVRFYKLDNAIDKKYICIAIKLMEAYAKKWRGYPVILEFEKFCYSIGFAQPEILIEKGFRFK